MTDWNSESAEWYAANYGEYATNRLAVDELDLPMDAIIVDVGCGTGAALRHAASKVTNGSLIGIDPVTRMIEIARSRSDEHPASARIEYRVGPAEDLPVEDKLADFVFAFDSIDHWQDIARGLNEIRRVLQPGGQFVVVKDGGVPGADKARKALVGSLEDSGFVVTKEKELTSDDVRFTLWICSDGEQ